MKLVVAAFNQEKALIGVGAFSVITGLRVDLRFKLYSTWSMVIRQRQIMVWDTHTSRNSSCLNAPELILKSLSIHIFLCSAC